MPNVPVATISVDTEFGVDIVCQGVTQRRPPNTPAHIGGPFTYRWRAGFDPKEGVAVIRASIKKMEDQAANCGFKAKEDPSVARLIAEIFSEKV